MAARRQPVDILELRVVLLGVNRVFLHPGYQPALSGIDFPQCIRWA